MPQESARKRRPRETTAQNRARNKQAGQAESATAKNKSEDAHKPWRAAWSKETGLKYGIATASKYNAWLDAKRKELGKKKAAGQTAKKQGDAIGPGQGMAETLKSKKKKDE